MLSEEARQKATRWQQEVADTRLCQLLGVDVDENEASAEQGPLHLCVEESGAAGCVSAEAADGTQGPFVQ